MCGVLKLKLCFPKNAKCIYSRVTEAKVYIYEYYCNVTYSVHCEIYIEAHSASSVINPLKTKRRLLYLKTQFVPRSKHFSSRL